MLRRTPLLLLLLTLTACQAPIRPAMVRPAMARPTPMTDAQPIAAPEAPAPTQAPPSVEVTVERLVAPTEAHVLLQGSIAIDAEYLLSTGQGHLIGHAGGNIIAAGGGNIIAAGGGNIIAAGGGNYALLADAPLTLGTMLRAAEMELKVFSMATCQQLTLGVDAAGQAIKRVYSDGEGGFQLYLPAAVRGQNVRVEATVPGRSEARFVYHTTWHAEEGEKAQIDEDTALASRIVREAFASLFERLLIDAAGTPAEDEAGHINGFQAMLPEALQPAAGPVLARIVDAARAADVPSLGPAPRRALAGRAADALLADVPLEEVEVDGALALAQVVGVLKDAREAARERMIAHAAEAGPGHERDFFSHVSFLIEANTRRLEDGLAPFSIDRPSDLFAYVLEDILVDSERSHARSFAPISEVLGLPVWETEQRFTSAVDALMVRATLNLFMNPDVAEAAVAAISGCES